MSTAVITQDVSVVICAYTERRYGQLCAAIRSVQRQTHAARAITVVIDHNTALYQRVCAQFPEIDVIENTQPQGLSGARNCGIAATTGTIVAFLDDDAEADDDWLQRLVKAFTNQQVMAVAGRILPRWPERPPQWLPQEFLWVVGCSYVGLPTSTAAVRNALGANMAFRREVFDAIGGFRSGLGRVGTVPLGCEETELSIRAHQHWPERTILYDPSVIVSHAVAPERARWRYFAARCYAEGISKATITRLVGTQPSLASERAYTLRTLPQGVRRNLGAMVRGDTSGFARAMTIILGLLITTLGYLVGKAAPQAVAASDVTAIAAPTEGITTPTSSPQPSTSSFDTGKARQKQPVAPVINVIATPGFHPRRVIETEISMAIPALPVLDPATGTAYAYALGVIRLHNQTLGLVELTLGETGLDAQAYATQIWQALQAPINEHLRQDGQPPITSLATSGITATTTPPCLQTLEHFLTDAPHATVIVTTHGDSPQLRRSLYALTMQHYPHYDITVADVAGDNATRALVADLAEDGLDIRYMTRKQAGPTATLYNRAIAAATGAIIAFTDDASIADTHWLAQLAQAFSTGEQVAAVTGLVLPHEFETPSQQWFEEYGGFCKGFTRQSFDKHTRRMSPLYPFNAGIFGTSASMAFTAAFLREHGGFDAALEGSHDLALFRTVITADATLIYEPGALLYYQIPRSYTDLWERIVSYGTGLGAYIAQCFLSRPQVALRGLSKIPHGLYYLLSPWSAKNRKRSLWYPRELLMQERRSMARGAARYVLSRLLFPGKARKFTPPSSPPTSRDDRLDGQSDKPSQVTASSSATSFADTSVKMQAGPIRGLAVRLSEHRQLLFNGLSMVATTGVTSLLGFAYWWVAARHYAPESVGFASALVSVMSLVGLLCMFGFGTMLMGELPRDPTRRESLLSASLIFVAGAAGICGLAFAAIAPAFSASFAPLRANIGVMLFFALAVSLSAVALVVDQALIGLLMGGQQLWRNTSFAVAKLVLLFVAALYVGQRGGLAIFATWIAGFAISLALLAAYGIARRGITRQSLHPDWLRLRGLWSDALQHHVLNSILLAANQLLPIIVIVTLSVKANAWFYLSFSLSNLVFMVGYSLSTALYAVNAADTTGLRQRLRVTVLISLVTCLVANLVVTFGATTILGIYGHAYAVQGAWSLRLLCLGAFPEIIHMHYVALQRINHTMKAAMLPLAIGGIAEILFAVIGAHVGGLTGLCLGWVLALICEALYMAPPVLRALGLMAARPGWQAAVLPVESQPHADAFDAQPIGQPLA